MGLAQRFYRDSRGRVRPITPRGSNLRVHGKSYPKALEVRKATSAGLPILRADEKPVKLGAPPQPPFNYAGGKYRMREKIIDKMPPHKTYVEPFAGAGNILQAKPPAEKEVLNDKDSNIVRVHRTIKSREQTWDLSPSRRHWEEIKRKSPSQRTAEEQSYFIDHSYGGMGKNYTEKGKGGKFETGKLHDRYADVVMKNDDFATVMRNWDSEQTLHYLDPPYTKGSEHFSSTVEPERVQSVARKMKGDVMISYDDSAKVRNNFTKTPWHISRVTVPRGISGQNVKAKELLITNYNPSKERAKAQQFDESVAKKELRIQEGI